MTVLRKEAALPRQGTAKVRDDVQKSDVRRTYRDEPAQQDKVLYPLQGMSVNPAFTYRKTHVYPGRSPMCQRLRVGQPALTAWKKSADGIVVGGNELHKSGEASPR